MDHKVTSENPPLHSAVVRGVNDLEKLLEQDEYVDQQDEFGNTALHIATSLDNAGAVDLLLKYFADVNLQNELGEAPLHIAVKGRNTDFVAKLLNNGANCNSRDKRGNSALTLALIHNFEPVVNLLFEQKNVDVYVSNSDGNSCHHLLVLQKNSALLETVLKKYHLSYSRDKKGRTPLHLAVVENFQRGFEMMLEACTYLYEQDYNGQTVLHVAVVQRNCIITNQLINTFSELYSRDFNEKSALDLAVSSDFQDAICLFLRKGADKRDDADETSYPLHMAVLKPNKPLLSELLSNGIDVDAKDNQDRTPLQWAIMRRFDDGIEMLLSKGADVNATDAFGNTALYYSILVKSVGLMKTLVEKGADINHQNIDGMSMIRLAVIDNFETGVDLLLAKGADVSVRDLHRGNSVLHTAVISEEHNMNRIEKKLLIHEGIDCNALNSYGNTSLHVAIGKGSESIVVLLLDKGVNVNVPNSLRYTPLHTAIREGKVRQNMNILNMLCEKGADLEMKSSDSETALHLAAYHKYTQAVIMLLEKGAAINEVGKFGNTALHFAVLQPFDQEESKLIVQALLNNGADLSQRNHYGETAVHIASSSGFESIVALLTEKGANVHELDDNHSTLLHKAVKATVKNKKLVEQLLSLGLHPNQKDKSGISLLHMAVKNSFGDAVKLLLEGGANVNYQDRSNNSILVIASCHPDRSILEHLISYCGMNINKAAGFGTALLFAVRERRYQNVKLLLKHNVNVNVINDIGNTALLEVCSNYCKKSSVIVVEIIKLLVNHGADLNAKTINGMTVLHMDTSENLVKLFLENNANINVQDKTGHTPLHLAIYRENLGIVKLLIESGAYLNLRSSDGTTVLHLAVKYHVISCLDLISRIHSEISNTCNYAVIQEYLDIIRILLDNVIEIEVKNNDTLTATCLASSINFQLGVNLVLEKKTATSQLNLSKEERLLHAVLNKDMHSIQELLNGYININYKKTKSALHLAVLQNFEYVVETLIKAGVNVNEKDNNENTSLHLAVIGKNVTIMNMLLENKTFLHSKNIDNRTALHLACINNFVQGVEMLVDRGALLDQQDCDGNTPLHLAIANTSIRSMLVLIQSGARIDLANHHAQSFFWMRLGYSKVQFWEVEELFVKLKFVFAEKSQGALGYFADREDIARLETRCNGEVSKIKSYLVGKNSLIDALLTDNKDPKFALISQLRAVVDSKSLQNDFPNYASLLKARVRRLETRYNLLNEASVLYILVKNCSKNTYLPPEIRRIILSELSNEDLVSLTEASITERKTETVN